MAQACKHCGLENTRAPGRRGRKPVHCSVACRRAHERVVGRERIMLTYAEVKARRRFNSVRFCAQCGGTFAMAGGGTGARRRSSPYCSPACLAQREFEERVARAARLTRNRCEECHGGMPLRILKKVSHIRFCSDACANRYNCRNRRGRIRGKFVACVSLGEIAERDRGICHICELPVRLDASPPDRLSPALDHVIPLARGGEHGPHNVRLAHFLCNSLKGAR